MKTLLILSLALSFNSFAADGLTIPNSFQVDRDGSVYRGKEPKKLVYELADIGITDVIIFKNDVRGEVKKEIEDLEGLGIAAHHIEFRWKDFVSMQKACEQTVEALNIIKRVKAKSGKVFFHCTAGEDRTGMLAGLYRMIDEGLTSEEVFKTEMCERGYSDGNPKKPGLVTGAIQKELTPLFIALSEKIEKDGKLTKRSCKGLKLVPTKLKCASVQ